MPVTTKKRDLPTLYTTLYVYRECLLSFGSTAVVDARLLEAAFKAGFNYFWVSPTKRLLSGSIDGGLIILSRYSIRNSDFIVIGHRKNISYFFLTQGVILGPYNKCINIAHLK